MLSAELAEEWLHRANVDNDPNRLAAQQRAQEEREAPTLSFVNDGDTIGKSNGKLEACSINFD